MNNRDAYMNDDYDSPWKEGMDLYFKERMQFFFPDIAADIAWWIG